jgi:hypothetical protein
VAIVNYYIVAIGGYSIGGYYWWLLVPIIGYYI